MKKDKVEVFIQFHRGNISCMCLASNKRCGKPCEHTTVEYDRYQGWYECFKNKPEPREKT